MVERIAMSSKELDRMAVLNQVLEKQLTQEAAASRLNLSSRQIRRLLKRLIKYGPAGLLRKHNTQSTPNVHDDAFKNKILDLLRSEYIGFGPTLASEKLKERNNIIVAKETLRRWMLDACLYKTKRQRKQYTHELRPRRPSFGELIQIDGSPHDWFEGRAPKCTLIVFIDDATSNLLALRFAEAETTHTYFSVLNDYLLTHGKPVALYSDKHGVFNVNAKEAESGTGLTQFGRALKTLNIQAIMANSPQAKGRVERANKTLQDRLIKEMRLEGIDSIDAANTFLPKFIKQYNDKFAVAAESDTNAHRELVPAEQARLPLILGEQQHRAVKKNMIVQYKNKRYQIINTQRKRALQKDGVTVCENAVGDVQLIFRGVPLEYERYDKNQHRSTTLSSKELNPHLDKTERLKPKKNINLLPITHGEGKWMWQPATGSEDLCSVDYIKVVYIQTMDKLCA